MRYIRYLLLIILLGSYFTGCVVIIKNNIGKDIRVNKDYDDSELTVQQEYDIKHKGKQ